MKKIEFVNDKEGGLVTLKLYENCVLMDYKPAGGGEKLSGILLPFVKRERKNRTPDYQKK